MNKDIPTHTNEQIRLLNFLQQTARRFYDADCQPLFAVQKDYRPESLNRELPRFMKRRNAFAIGKWLAQNQIVECAHLPRSTFAHVFVAWSRAGKICAVRVPRYEADPAEEHRRLPHATVLQPLRDKDNKALVFPIWENAAVQVLPFGPVVNLENYGKDLEKAHIAAGLRYDKLAKLEFIPMPNGSPLSVDPGLIRSAEQRRQSYKAQGAVQTDVINSHPFMAVIPWIKNGRAIQNAYFEPGYLTKPRSARPQNIQPNHWPCAQI